MTAILRKISNLKLQSSKTQKGFTLIELLVVIGILGILASALVATIDPFEQLKKANDATVKNTAVEFINANIRYYTTHNNMPWHVDPNCNTGSADPTAATLQNNAMTGCLTALINDGEIKQAFTSATGILSSILITGTTNNVIACFQPQSKAQQRDANTRWDATGQPTAGCVGQTATSNITTCYWCSQ